MTDYIIRAMPLGMAEVKADEIDGAFAAHRPQAEPLTQSAFGLTAGALVAEAGTDAADDLIGRDGDPIERDEDTFADTYDTEYDRDDLDVDAEHEMLVDAGML